MAKPITLFVCGDVMTGRGIDQILPHPSEPDIFEPYMTSATGYVQLAEERNGPIPRSVDPSYVWGDALAELERVKPAARIINLETTITTADDAAPKGINYRMHPANIAAVSSARIDCCVLANNHVLDWGERGLIETLEVLRRADVRTAGAGKNRTEAQDPAALRIAETARVLVFSLGLESSGIAPEWAATEDRPGVYFLEDLSDWTLHRVGLGIHRHKGPHDLVIASIHWGSNWGYEVSADEARFAHGLIDRAGVDLVHGHSSHHPKAIEVYRDKLILYGCGDFINDYEGITNGRGYDKFRGDLGLMYFPTIDLETRRLIRLEMRPTQMKLFRVVRASHADAGWLSTALTREGKRFRTSVELRSDDLLVLSYNHT